MRCPLCRALDHEEGSPLASPDPETEARLFQASWMAIEALDGEAAYLRGVRADGWERQAEEAEAQAALLRAFARAHSSDPA